MITFVFTLVLAILNIICIFYWLNHPMRYIVIASYSCNLLGCILNIFGHYASWYFPSTISTDLFLISIVAFSFSPIVLIVAHFFGDITFVKKQVSRYSGRDSGRGPYRSLPEPIQNLKPSIPNSPFTKQGVPINKRIEMKQHVCYNNVIIQWKFNNKLHRNGDLPALYFFKDGNLSTIHYWKHNKLHRTTGPALINYANKDKIYFFQNKEHDSLYEVKMLEVLLSKMLIG